MCGLPSLTSTHENLLVLLMAGEVVGDGWGGTWEWGWPGFGLCPLRTTHTTRKTIPPNMAAQKRITRRINRISQPPIIAANITSFIQRLLPDYPPKVTPQRLIRRDELHESLTVPPIWANRDSFNSSLPSPHPLNAAKSCRNSSSTCSGPDTVFAISSRNNSR